MADESRGDPPQPGSTHIGPANLFAGLSFVYALGATLALLLATGFFKDEQDAGRVMAWLTVPIIFAFVSWVGVRSGNKLMRLFVWFAILACFFFCWISIFSIGLFYLPVPLLLIVAVLTPWDELPAVSRPMPLQRSSPAPDEILQRREPARTRRRVSYLRRFWGDDLLEGLLQVCTLGVGWLLWFAIVARHGQTPAKQLLRVRIYDHKTHEVASVGQVWMREVVGKLAVPIILGTAFPILTGSITSAAFGQVYGILVGLQLLLAPIDADERAAWDYIAGTTIKYYG
jgi:uncharacterized RDD family membrane protein YckC